MAVMVVVVVVCRRRVSLFACFCFEYILRMYDRSIDRAYCRLTNEIPPVSVQCGYTVVNEKLF